MGKVEGDIIRQAAKSGMPLPERIKNRPELLPGLEFIWRAFWDLATCRTIGMGEGPIWWIAVNDYANRYGITDEDEFDRFKMLIKELDSVFLDHRDKKRTREMNKGKGRTKSKTPMKSRT
jgi:hypothetical protein